MRQKSMSKKEPAEKKAVRDIRRRTRLEVAQILITETRFAGNQCRCATSREPLLH